MRQVTIPLLVAPLFLYGCTDKPIVVAQMDTSVPGKDAEGADRVAGEDRPSADAEAEDRDIEDRTPNDSAFADSGEMDAAGMDAAGMDAATPCTYPAFADPMQVGQGIPPYTWPAAIDMATTVQLDLDLLQVHCDTDLDIDWGLFDKILIVANPAW